MSSTSRAIFLPLVACLMLFSKSVHVEGANGFANRHNPLTDKFPLARDRLLLEHNALNGGKTLGVLGSKRREWITARLKKLGVPTSDVPSAAKYRGDWANPISRSSSKSASPSPSPSVLPGFMGASGCRYTSPQVAEAASVFFLNKIMPNLLFLVTGSWETFDPNLPDAESNVFSDYTTNPLYQSATEYYNVVTSALEDPQVTSLEKIELENSLMDVVLLRKLFETGHILLPFGGQFGGSWYYSFLAMTPDILFFLASPFLGFSAAPDYVPRVLTYLNSLAAKLTRHLQLMKDSVAAGVSHSKFEMDLEYSGISSSAWIEFTLTVDHTVVCASVATVDPSEGTTAACMAAATAVNDALAALKAYYEDPVDGYLAACAALRPNSKPGLVHLPNGPQMYQHWMNYHLGYAAVASDAYQTGDAHLTQTVADLVDVTGAPDLPTALMWMGDAHNDTYNWCGPTASQDAVSQNLQFVNSLNEAVTAEIGYFPRAKLTVVPSGDSDSSWQPGVYDPSRNFHILNGYYSFAHGGIDETCGVYYPRFGLVDVFHEILGHAQHINLFLEIGCSFGLNWPAATVEGWALYTETLGYRLFADTQNPLGMYADATQHAGQLLRDAKTYSLLVADAAVHADLTTAEVAPWSVDQALAALTSHGFTADTAESLLLDLIGGPGFFLYGLGRFKLVDLRQHCETTLGPLFDAAEFNNVVTRFGVPNFSQLEDLVHMYEHYVIDGEHFDDHHGEFGFDLIQSMFSTAQPVVGYGR